MNTILDSFNAWLNSRKKKFPGAAKFIDDLSMRLATVDGIEQLERILHSATLNSKTDLPLEITNKISEWLKLVEDLHSRHLIAYIRMQESQPEEDNISLLAEFIRQLLEEPAFLLHQQCNSCLTQILDNEVGIEEIFQFLSELEDVQAVKNPRTGSFEAISPRNDEHKAALQFMRNIATLYNQSNQKRKTDMVLTNAANALLQNLIIIDKDINPPPALKNENEEEEEEQQSCCLCM